MTVFNFGNVEIVRQPYLNDPDEEPDTSVWLHGAPVMTGLGYAILDYLRRHDAEFTDDIILTIRQEMDQHPIGTNHAGGDRCITVGGLAIQKWGHEYGVLHLHVVTAEGIEIELVAGHNARRDLCLIHPGHLPATATSVPSPDASLTTYLNIDGIPYDPKVTAVEPSEEEEGLWLHLATKIKPLPC